jgi:uncharacterized protein (TIGR03435 family)
MPTPVLVVDHVNQTPSDNLPDVTIKLPTVPAPTEFEVAVIKPSAPDSNERGIRFLPGGRLNVQSMPVKILIMFAWDIDITGIVLSGAPKWVDSERFDIVAKPPDIGSPTTAVIDIDSMRLMLCSLPADRFKLKTHTETEPVNVYALVAKGKTKLKQADESSRSTCKYTPLPLGTSSALTNSYTCQNTTMAQLVHKARQMAPGYIDRPVIDSTGLEGGWDFVLSWTASGIFNRGGRGGGTGQQVTPSSTSGPSTPGLPAASDPSGGVSFFEAVEKLGLKLELQKHPMPVLVIDHVEAPSEN